jgi:hypothetical protein
MPAMRSMCLQSVMWRMLLQHCALHRAACVRVRRRPVRLRGAVLVCAAFAAYGPPAPPTPHTHTLPSRMRAHAPCASFETHSVWASINMNACNTPSHMRHPPTSSEQALGWSTSTASGVVVPDTPATVLAGLADTSLTQDHVMPPAFQPRYLEVCVRGCSLHARCWFATAGNAMPPVCVAPLCVVGAASTRVIRGTVCFSCFRQPAERKCWDLVASLFCRIQQADTKRDLSEYVPPPPYTHRHFSTPTPFAHAHASPYLRLASYTRRGVHPI